MRMRKPWLGIAVRTDTNPDGTKDCVEVLYYTPSPILADLSSDVRKTVFAEAVRAQPDLDPADVEVYAIPFASPN